MKRVKLLCAIAAICAIAAASSAFAKSPTAVVAIQNGKAMLKKAIETGKYAQDGNVQNFGLNDDSEDILAQIEEGKKKLAELKKNKAELGKKLGIQVDSRDSSDPDANAIKWYKPTNLKDNSSTSPGTDGSSGKVLPPGWIDCIDSLYWCNCYWYPCTPIYPCGVFDDGCGCNSYEMGCEFVDDCSCSLDCGLLCEPGRPCRVRSAIGRVFSRVGALKWR